MKTKRMLIVVSIIAVILIGFISITKLLASFKNESFEILPNIIITKEELSSIKKVEEIEKVVKTPSENILIYNGLEKNADYSKMSSEEIYKSDLATQKNWISIHYDDGIIFDILSAKCDSKEVLYRAFNWYRSGAHQVSLNEEDPSDIKIGDKLARLLSVVGADILVAYKNYLFYIGCIHPPVEKLSTEDMEMAESLAKLILKKVDEIK